MGAGHQNYIVFQAISGPLIMFLTVVLEAVVVPKVIVNNPSNEGIC